MKKDKSGGGTGKTGKTGKSGDSGGKASPASTGGSGKQGKSKKDLTPEEIVDPKAAARAKAQANRAVVAGISSWTGKLPATLLYEHCQKQKWEKVVFDSTNQRQTKNGFVITAVLGKKNSKTGEIDTVRMVPPPDLVEAQPSALEARHITATYALHRIMSHKNLRLMLPPSHRDLWTKMDDIKKSQDEGNMYLYSEDPFQAQIDHQLALDKKKKDIAESRAKREKQNVVNSVRQALHEEEKKKREEAGAHTNEKESKEASPGPDEERPRRVRFNNGLAMSRTARSTVEQTIRKYHGFRSLSSAGAEAAIKASEKDPQMIATLRKLGFERFEVEEALEHASTLSAALEWLLIHVPEDDLPEMFSDQHVGGVAADIQSGDLKVEYAVRELRQYGYSQEIAREALLENQGDKRKAVVSLTKKLLGGPAEEETSPSGRNGSQDSVAFWNEEMESLMAIYDDESIFKVQPDGCTMDMDVEISDANGKKKESKVRILFWRSDTYPHDIPGFVIEPKIKVAKYVLLDLIKRAAVYAVQNCLGDFMVLSIAEWVKDNFDLVCRNPSKLSEIASGVSGDAETELTTINKKKESKIKDGTETRKKDIRKHKRLLLSSEQLKAAYEDRLEGAELPKMIAGRRQLPAWRKKEEIVNLINKHQIVLVTGETGSGKSTQVVQFVLDDLLNTNKGATGNIICTQPRRISAMGLAQRVADERAVPVGQEVGYVIRGESKVSSATQIRFVTAGVLLRMIQTNGPKALEDISHVVIDEVHERSLDGDYLLILVKRLCKASKDLKVVLMSATVDPQMFINYFGGSKKVGYTHIEGRTFPVKDIFLDQLIPMLDYVPRSMRGGDNDDSIGAGLRSPRDVGRIIISLKDGIDYELLTRTVEKIHKEDLKDSDGSILIFMSGSAEIDRSIAALEQSLGSQQIWALPLHSSLSPGDQRRVFNRAPTGRRKVVVSTNIAETSITIPDVVAVIDSGRVKETVYHAETNVVKLVDQWASKASVTQRRGRAGRVREGVCYKLYTESLQRSQMPERPDPEIKRSPLDHLYLSVKAMGIGDVARFLSEALDPPDTEALETARKSLVACGAIDDVSNHLTALGKHISMIPVDVRSAKLLILSAVFGCLDAGLTTVSVMAVSNPFFAPKDLREEAKAALKRFAGEGQGDLMACLAAYDQWQKLRQDKSSSSSSIRRWCKDNFLSSQTLNDIASTRRQLLAALQEIGFIQSDDEKKIPAHYNKNNVSDKLIRAIIAAAMKPNIAEIVLPQRTYIAVSGGAVEKDAEAKSIKFYTPSERVFIHPASSLFGTNKFINDCNYLSFGSKMVTTKLFVNNVTPVNSYGLLFFSDSIKVDPLGLGIVADEWIGLKCWPRVGILMRILQQLFYQLLDAKFTDPLLDISDHDVARVVQMLIQTNGMGYR